jgi:hypothetical protein
LYQLKIKLNLYPFCGIQNRSRKLNADRINFVSGGKNKI